MSIFDLFAVALFIGTAGVFITRYRHEDPPVAPYALIFVVSAVGNWLGEKGAGGASVCLFIAGAFLLLHVASLPYPEDREDGAPRR
ncbi:MAG: hypothetical protein RIE56_05630 [Amphiplicatus sp.]